MYFVSSGRIYFVCSALGQVKKKKMFLVRISKKKRDALKRNCVKDAINVILL